MHKILSTLAVIGFASSVSAGTLVAPGPAQSVTGAVVALPGVGEAISGGDASGTVTLPNALSPTQMQNIANAYGVPYVPGRPLTVLAVVIVGAGGRPVSADLLISGEGVATLELAANDSLVPSCS